MTSSPVSGARTGLRKAVRMRDAGCTEHRTYWEADQASKEARD